MAAGRHQAWFMPDNMQVCLTLFHPDYHRRLRLFTGSADPLPVERRSRAPRCKTGIPPVGNCTPP